MGEINIKTTDFKTEFSFNKKQFMASLGLFEKEYIEKIIENNKNNFRLTRSGAVYNNMLNMATQIAENISYCKRIIKAKKKTNNKNQKIKYNTKLQNKDLIQQDFEESEVEQQQIKNIKTKVKKQPKTKPESLKLNPQQSITDESIISIMNEVNETITFNIILPQENLKSLAGPELLAKEQSKEENENVKSMLHKKNENHSKVIMLANEDNTKQINHDQFSSDTTHLIIPKLCLWVPYDKTIKIQTDIINFIRRISIPMTHDQIVTDVFDLKWMNEFKSILLNKKLKTVQCRQSRRIQKIHEPLQKTGVLKYQSSFDKNKNLNRCLVNFLLRRSKKMNISLPIELKKYCNNIKIRTANRSGINYGHAPDSTYKIVQTSEPIPLMAITAPRSLSMKKEDMTTAIVNQKRQSKYLDEHSTVSRINMIQAFQKLKESSLKNKQLINQLLMLEHCRKMGDLVVIDHK